MTVDGLPSNPSGRSDPSMMAESLLRSAMCAAPTVNADAPNAFESCKRRRLPPMLVRTIILNVWLLKLLGGRGAALGCCCAGWARSSGEAAQVETQCSFPFCAMAGQPNSTTTKTNVMIRLVTFPPKQARPSTYNVRGVRGKNRRCRLRSPARDSDPLRNDAPFVAGYGGKISATVQRVSIEITTERPKEVRQEIAVV